MDELESSAPEIPDCRYVRLCGSIIELGWHSQIRLARAATHVQHIHGISGVPMPVLQSLLGHTSTETTTIYAHPREDAQRGA